MTFLKRLSFSALVLAMSGTALAMSQLPLSAQQEPTSCLQAIVRGKYTLTEQPGLSAIIALTDASIDSDVTEFDPEKPIFAVFAMYGPDELMQNVFASPVMMREVAELVLNTCDQVGDVGIGRWRSDEFAYYTRAASGAIVQYVPDTP